MEEIKQKIIKEYGEKCKDFEYFCPICITWYTYEALVSMLELK